MNTSFQRNFLPFGELTTCDYVKVCPLLSTTQEDVPTSNFSSEVQNNIVRSIRVIPENHLVFEPQFDLLILASSPVSMLHPQFQCSIVASYDYQRLFVPLFCFVLSCLDFGSSKPKHLSLHSWYYQKALDKWRCTNMGFIICRLVLCV